MPPSAAELFKQAAETNRQAARTRQLVLLVVIAAGLYEYSRKGRR